MGEAKDIDRKTINRLMGSLRRIFVKNCIIQLTLATKIILKDILIEYKRRTKGMVDKTWPRREENQNDKKLYETRNLRDRERR